MRLLVLSQNFPPEMNAGGIRFSEMIPEWRERGHEATVIAQVPNYPTGVVAPKYRRRLFVEEERPDGTRVIRTWVYPAANSNLLARKANFASFVLFALLLSVLRVGRVNAVIATSPPLSVLVLGRIVAAVKRARLVLDVRDLWPETAASLGVMSGPWLRCWEFIERWLYRAAWRIVVVSRAFIPSIANALPRDGRNKIRFVPNGVRLDQFGGRAEPARLFRARIGVPQDAYLLVYVGAHGLGQGLTEVVKAFARSPEPGTYICFVGDGAEKEEMLRIASRHDGHNMVFLEIQPRSEIPAIYAAADLALVALRDAPVFEKVIPSKVFEIMAAGRPMVVFGGREVQRIVAEAGSGFFVEAGNTEALVQTVRVALRSEDLEEMGKAGRKYVECHFDRYLLATQYLDILEEDVLQKSCA